MSMFWLRVWSAAQTFRGRAEAARSNGVLLTLRQTAMCITADSGSFLAARRKEFGISLPLAVRKTNIVSLYRLTALPVQRARLKITALPQAVTTQWSTGSMF